MVSEPFGQLGFDRGMFVRGVVIVVDDGMHVERLGHDGIDMMQEREELLVAIAALALKKWPALGRPGDYPNIEEEVE